MWEHNGSIRSIGLPRLLPPITDKFLPLIWEEHCTECAIPECYQSCVLYEKRPDGACRRFSNGIEFESSGKNTSARIQFKRWGKLESIVPQRSIEARWYPFLEILNNFIWWVGTTSTHILGKPVVQNALSWRRRRWVGKEFFTGGVINKTLLIEIIECQYESIFIVEIASTSRVFFSSSFNAPKGASQHSITIPAEVFLNLGLLIRIAPSGDYGSDVVFGLLELLELASQPNDSVVKPAEFVKCVVWDLDNTLWSGIYSEDEDLIQIRPEALEVIRILDSRGILNSIASKNNESEVIPKLRELGIIDYFLIPKINWEPKSKNIVEIAQSLDIGLDTFLFIDDSEFELAEVATTLKQVRVRSSINLENILDESFLNPKVSLESKNRRGMYQLDLIRKEGERDSGLDYRSFLLNSNLEMSVQLIEENELSRAHELLSRTNQLNISGKRYTLDELRTEILLPNVKWISANVNDKYGSYGQVLIAKVVTTPVEILIEELAISCRVAERRVEDSFFQHIRDTTAELGKPLIVSFTESGKNQRMEVALQRMGFQKRHSGEYVLSGEKILVDSVIVKSKRLN